VKIGPVTRRHPKALSPTGLPPTDAPAWIDGIDNPYLHGLFAPTTVEIEPRKLAVEGTLPRDLHGAYFRNGPNNRFPPRNRYHWFDGDGLVQGLWFEDGEARYGSRMIATWGLAQEEKAGAAIWPGVLGPFDFGLKGGPLKDTANTDLIVHDGRLLASWYQSGRLYVLDPWTLETRGAEDFDRQVRVPVSAHPKVDPRTGELLFFGYTETAPYMRYGVVRTDGSVHLVDITLPGRRFPHDMGVTDRFSVLHDFPVFYDPGLFAKTGKRVPLFQRDVPTRFGVIPRFGTDADLQWFEFEPCYMLHVVNCWEEGDTVVMVGHRQPDPTLRPDPADGVIGSMLSGLHIFTELHEWRMNTATGEGSERVLDRENTEFPTIAPDDFGRKGRYAYLTALPHEIPATFDGLVKYDLHHGAHSRYMYGAGIFGSEAPFAPRVGGTADDDGYLLSIVTDARDWTSACLVFSAQDLAAGPIARVPLPRRVPAGFHATWMPGEELRPA